MQAWNLPREVNLPVQAARSRASEPSLRARIQGYQRVKSRKVVIPRLLAVPAKSDPEGRVGPPESGQKPEKSGKARKRPKTVFLRVPRALGQAWPSAVIGRSWAHSVPRTPSSMRGSEGSWSPRNVVAALQAAQGSGLPRPFTMQGNQGSWSPGYVIGRYTRPPCTGPFQAQYRGIPASRDTQLRMHIRGPCGLEAAHPPRPLEDLPLADGDMEAPIGSSIGRSSAL